jgi:hypothetical protein
MVIGKRAKLRMQLLLGLSAALAFARLTAAQQLIVQKEDRTSIKISSADVAEMPHQKVVVDDHGKAAVFEGPPLHLVLERAGVSFGESLRGKRMADCLLVEAADGYRVVIALAELDPGFTDRVTLLADKRDGKMLEPKEGPFRIIIPGEKRMARWARQVITLRIVAVQ